MADHPVFKLVIDRVNIVILAVEKSNHAKESQLRKRTAKGQYLSYLMSYNFIYEVAVYLGKKNTSNLATLYLLKYCIAELNRIKREVSQNVNVVSHPDWPNFVQTS